MCDLNQEEDYLNCNTLNSEVLNKGFTFLNNIFFKNGWRLTNNLINHIRYSKPGLESVFFEIRLDRTKIYVSIPLKNSSFQYKTSFNDYLSACDYVEQRFIDFINDENNINTNQQ